MRETTREEIGEGGTVRERARERPSRERVGDREGVPQLYTSREGHRETESK